MRNNSPEPDARPNITQYSVSEISLALKRTVEAAFGQVRVRGEISGFKRAPSGHCYFKLKDEKAVLDAICWRGTKLDLSPEDGLEVICKGRVTTYPGRSNYQIVIEEMELAGEGALLKLLEARRKKLDGEGLFAAERKQPIPYLPERIGVVTSPTGAVIRDILHRLDDRFPRHVLLWPTLVQGEGAAAAIAAAIEGFNRLEKDGPIPRPDVLIVARGGGSLEDLWAFNEENVVRATAASKIPLISAIGHETDTTLIDFAADRRAPTPTAAAEMAVPVRAELLEDVLDHSRRLVGTMTRFLDGNRLQVAALARGLPDPKALLEMATQRLDEWTDRLVGTMPRFLEGNRLRVAALARGLPDPKALLEMATQRLNERADRLNGTMPRFLEGNRLRVAALARGLTDPKALLEMAAQRLDERTDRLESAVTQNLQNHRHHLTGLDRLLESLSYARVLDRGFALVRGPKDEPLTSAGATKPGMAVGIHFNDGRISAVIDGAKTKKVSAVIDGAKTKKPNTKKTPAGKPGQGDLF